MIVLRLDSSLARIAEPAALDPCCQHTNIWILMSTQIETSSAQCNHNAVYTFAHVHGGSFSTNSMVLTSKLAELYRSVFFES